MTRERPAHHCADLARINAEPISGLRFTAYGLALALAVVACVVLADLAGVRV
jgi:hypothetical protein